MHFPTAPAGQRLQRKMGYGAYKQTKYDQQKVDGHFEFNDTRTHPNCAVSVYLSVDAHIVRLCAVIIG